MTTKEAPEIATREWFAYRQAEREMDSEMYYFELYKTLTNEGIAMKEAFEIVQIIRSADSGDLFSK
jgi:hypothetical protein